MMATEAGGPPLSQSDSTVEELLASVLQPLARLFMAGGLTAVQVLDATRAALDTSCDRRPFIAPVSLGSRQRDCMEVMCLWRRHRSFLTERGDPAQLPIRGQTSSFEVLCREARVENSPERVLEALVQFGAVAVSDRGYVHALTPTFLLGTSNSSAYLAVDGILKQLAGFIGVIEHNVLGPTLGHSSRFERACSVTVAEELIPIANRLIRERGQEFIDSVDEWLERHRNVASPKNRYHEIGAGAYMLQTGRKSTEKMS